MKAECMPIVKLEIRPMVMNMIQSMGIENSELADAIKEAANYEFKRQLKEIPNIVREEVLNLISQTIENECDSWAKSKYGKDFFQGNSQWNTDFKTAIKTEVMITITELCNRKSDKKD